jgi:hypothetical protein
MTASALRLAPPAENPDRDDDASADLQQSRRVALAALPDPVLARVHCPFCDDLHSGYYNRETHQFVCSSVSCRRRGEVVDYSEFVEELDRQTREFFERFPVYVEGTSTKRIREIALHLLACGVDPHLALQLVCAWNECVAAPPMAKRAVVEIVEGVAAELRRSAGR